MQNMSFLDEYNGDFEPKHNGIRDKVDVLPDGQHTLEVIDTKWEDINGKPVVKVGLKLTGSAITVEHIYWLNEQSGVNQLGADLLAIGQLPDGAGSKAKPLSKVIPEAVGKLPGLRVDAVKGSYVSKKDRFRKATFKLVRLAEQVESQPQQFGTPSKEMPF